MQLDYGLAMRVANWQDPAVNIDAAAKLLVAKRNYIAGKLPGLDAAQSMKAAIAAYNSGEGTVVKLLLANSSADVDARTTGGNYSKSVLADAKTFSGSAQS
jgi:hypothetical protein